MNIEDILWFIVNIELVVIPWILVRHVEKWDEEQTRKLLEKGGRHGQDKSSRSEGKH